MPLPPSNVEPAALWVALQQLPRPQRVVDYPRLDPILKVPVGQVIIQVVSQAEQMSAAAEADRYTVAMMKRSPRKDEHSEGYETIYNNECSVQLIFRAVRRVDTPTLPFFPSPDAIRELTQDEVGTLVRQYLIVQRELGPIVDRMTAEEMDAWLEVLAKGASMFPLARLGSDAVRDLVMHSARRLYPSATDTSSSGSPPDVSGTDTSPRSEGALTP